MPFKIKNKKKKNCEARITLDATHNNKFDQLNNKKSELYQKKKDLLIKETELLNLQSNTTHTENEHELEIVLKDTINNYKEFIIKNENLDIN